MLTSDHFCDAVVSTSTAVNCCVDVQTECLVHSFHRTLQMKVLGNCFNFRRACPEVSWQISF